MAKAELRRAMDDEALKRLWASRPNGGQVNLIKLLEELSRLKIENGKLKERIFRLESRLAEIGD
tara:strand:- start:1165 stop:1356 length:192 start_codon:yes stop_codon:yes gene_type:complete